jgi:hypothetical protein
VTKGPRDKADRHSAPATAVAYRPGNVPKTEEAVMIETADRTRLRTLTRHVATDQAKDTVGKALYEVVLEAIDFGPGELPTPDEREWIRGAVAMPLQEATQVALEILAWRISQSLAGAPETLRDRFDRSHEWASLGWE